jgi:uncharacterized protein (UPF0179 family)
LSLEALAMKEELNNAIRDELKIREAAGELLQRISATHRQCEADLRKLLVQTKMKTIANILDMNDRSTISNEGMVTVSVNIEEVAQALKSEKENLNRQSSSKERWCETLKCWIEGLCTEETISGRSHDDGSITKLVEESQHNTSQPNKNLVQPPESNHIRSVIKTLLAKQLSDCSGETSPNHLRVLIPVLQGMNGYICGRLSFEEKDAILAYAEGALGDQARIMKCLVKIFLSYSQSVSHNLSPNETLTSTTNDCSSAITTSESEPSTLIPDVHLSRPLTCSQVEDFLTWSCNVGDLIGLQVRLCGIDHLLTNNILGNSFNH